MAYYLLVNDIHAADRPPSSCTDSYLEDLVTLLMQTARLAEQCKAVAAVWAGDVFHVKAPSRTSHKLVQVMIEVVRSYPCPVFIVPGNHDMQNDRLGSVEDTQPLGVLFKAGARRLEGWDGDKGYLYGVPWLQGYGPHTEQSGPAVHEALADWRAAYGEGRRQPGLVVTHAPLYPPGTELPFEHFPGELWSEAMGNRGSCWYGHVHERHGEWVAGRVNYANFGALSRGSLHEYNLTRVPAVGTWDTSTSRFTEIPLRARPAAEVFRLAEKAEATDIQGRLDEFLEQVGHTTLETVSAEAVVAAIRGMGLPQPVVDLATSLLEEATHGR